ncbi:MAG: endo-1,4-beta-xylanase [Verrucomicrobiota bacterium]
MSSPALLARLLLPFGLLLPVSQALATPGGGEPDTMEAIRRHRQGTLTVLAQPGVPVKIEQTRHEFWFGAALANQAFNGRMAGTDAARYREAFLANFNSAVTENALKWAVMEPRRGQVDYRTVDAILAWTGQHHIPLRGHNIYWGIEKFVPDWLKAMDNETLRRTLEARGRDIGRRYHGRFAEYDLNNEMLHGNYYADRLGAGITQEMAAWVKAEDPDARLYLNDYDITTGRQLDRYVAQIRDLLQQGVPIAGIGVQGHLHGETFDRAALRHALDTLAQFSLPIRVTEFNIPGQRSRFCAAPKTVMTPEEEKRTAHELTDFYRICFSHPSVTGILMWGFWEGANWIPASSLYRRDWTPTPAGLAYRDLLFREWWTRWEGETDEAGRFEAPAFFGAYLVTAGNRQARVQLTKQSGRVTVDLR